MVHNKGLRVIDAILRDLGMQLSVVTTISFHRRHDDMPNSIAKACEVNMGQTKPIKESTVTKVTNINHIS